MTAPIPRLFVLRRDRDVTGVSGPGDVADGVQWPDGTVALRWRGRASTSLWDSLELMLSVHGHDGATRAVWLDEQQMHRARIEPHADRPYLEDRIGRALANAAQSSTWGEEGIARWTHISGDHGDFVNAVMETVDQLLGQRDRAHRTAGRAYLLADRWQAAHGTSMFLVRAAGAELRDELDGEAVKPESCTSNCEGTTGIRGLLEHVGIDTRGRDITVAGRVVDAASNCSNPDHACVTCRDCRYEHPGEGGCLTDQLPPTAGRSARTPCTPADQAPPNRGPLTGIEVRDPCPYCKGSPLIPRALMDKHIRERHPDVLDDGVELARNALLSRGGRRLARAVDRLIRAVERRAICDLPHEMEV